MRIDPKLKKDVEKAAAHYGLNFPDVINIYLKSVQKNKSTIIDVMTSHETEFLSLEESNELQKSIDSGWATDEEVKAVFSRTFK